MRVSKLVDECIREAHELAVELGHDYITPEHILYILCSKQSFKEALRACGADEAIIQENLKMYFETYLENVGQVEPMESFALQQALIIASQQVISSGKDCLEIEHLIAAIMNLAESYGAYYLMEQGVTQRDLLFEFCHVDEQDVEKSQDAYEEAPLKEEKEQFLDKYLINLNEYVRRHPEPIVERPTIIERTLEVLCRKTKNNPIHIGEPGVGKTAITLALAKRINEEKVPKVLKGATLFSLDLGGILAGTQYRGDFEKRLKKVLELIKTYERPMVYIDEIHNLVGAGALGNGSLDASNLLKPYLVEGDIRFIGATTFEEYKKYFEKDKGLVRRFQTIEVKEPTVEECLDILKGLKSSYEAYHGVTYTEAAIEAAVKLSHQYMNERFLPDKAIDLMDEAGAYMTMNSEESKRKIVTPQIIETILSRICHVPKKTVAMNEVKKLKNLESCLKKQIFGQDHAILAVTKYIKLSRAGLGATDKPVASMLFVGPTGVGKTEVAKCLAEELGMKLIRFDMSEYGEKHTASKLIGAPPGYVGYEEGGLLTDAIRKTPHAVLLLDEIEKAHADVFNMLLQVMDYATLTDNQGKKADFRNVIIIMTSNAGARQMGKQLVGFGERQIQEEAMEEEVKKLFSPEFRNRLNGVITFNHLDEEMAKHIAMKALKELKDTLKEKKIEFMYTKQLLMYIVKEGTSKEFGAREIKRIIEGRIKPLLVDEILFGKLQKGGRCKVTVEGGDLRLNEGG